jgi:ABC-2 type transport system permease protein
VTVFAGLGPLTRLALRRDRIMLAAWVYALTAVACASVAATRKLYPTAASREQIAAGAGASRVTEALYGPAADLHTLGGLALWKMNAIGAVLAAVMSMLIVARHTRGDEDAGRLELAGAGAVGRAAALTTALLTAVLANVMLALLLTLGLAVTGLPVLASLGYGLGLAATGMVFAAVTGVSAQVAGHARSATGIAAAVLAAAYLLRAAGDAAGQGSWAGALTWLSPVGWMEKVRPFGPLEWWPLALAPLLTIIVAGLAYTLSARRDLGTGLLPEREGRPAAGPGLAGPLGLAWRLQRGSLAGWVAGFAVGGAVAGGIANGIGDLAGDSQPVRDMFTRLGGHGGLVDAYLAAVMGILGMLAAIYAAGAVLRLNAEETGQRASPVLATAVTRERWAASHLVFAVAGPALLLAVAGLTAGLAHGAATGALGTELPRMLGSALAQVPAAWVLGGLAVALFGVAPRLAAATWAAGLAAIGIAELGGALGLSHWALDFSPFTHVPKLPGPGFTAAPLLWLTVAAAALAATGLAGLHRRDLA